jgi:surface polysaccharide O-acyltransferase-like enzyme
VSVVCKAAVPLFFMVSGATLLGKEETVKQLFRKRVLRILLVIVIFSMIQYLAEILMKGERSFDAGFFVTHLVRGDVTEQYWFLYAYMAFLIALPVLRPLAAGLTDNVYRYLLLTALIWNYLPPLLKLVTGLQFSSSFSLFYTGQLIFYPLAGFYMARMADSELNDRPGVAGAVLAAIIASGMIIEYVSHMLTGEWGLQEISVMPVTLLLFRILRILGSRINGHRSAFVIYFLGGLSFGIYLMELIARRLWKDTYLMLCDRTTGVVACSFYIVLSYVTAAFISFTMKKVPLLKKLL